MANNTLIEKMVKSGSLKGRGQVMGDSRFFGEKSYVPLGYPILNVAFSAKVNGGLTPGLTIIAGESKTFKTLLGLLCMKAYLDEHEDGIAILYDSEFGITNDYLINIGIDTSRVVHIPIMNIEELKFDFTQKLNDIEKDDKVYFFVDSLGNLASKKEVEDAEDGKSVADMSRAKQVKSLFRIITPHFTLKDIPCVMINHTYKEQGCLSGDTLVKTTKGIKEIQHIDIGDYVFGNTGIQEVTNTLTPLDLSMDDKEYFELEFDDGSKVKCTGNHKFLLKNGKWIEAKDMNIGLVFK